MSPEDVDGNFAPLGAALSLKRGGADEEEVTESAARRGGEAAEAARRERGRVREAAL